LVGYRREREKGFIEDKIMKRFAISIALILTLSTLALAQNANSSATPTKVRPRTTVAKPAASPHVKPATTETPGPAPSVTKRASAATPGSEAVLAAFNKIRDGIRHANVNEVTEPYWNDKQLLLFNNNGTVTRGWDQMRKNRESSYPDMKDVKLDVRDVRVSMLGRDGALVTCLWTQSQTYKGVSETASGRMSLVFKRVGNEWKVIHLHTSPDAPNPSRVLPSEQTPTPTP
jgi:hypothetical protein